MAEGTDNVVDRISCDDSSYGECNLEVYNSGNGVNSGSEDEEYGGGDKELYQFTYGNRLDYFATLHPAPIAPKMVLTLCNLCWCLFSVDPICICTHTNEAAKEFARITEGSVR